MSAAILDTLRSIRGRVGPRRTPGLDDDVVQRFADADPELVAAITDAGVAFEALAASDPDLVSRPEADLIRELQNDYVNFYEDADVNPYIPIAGRGPWIVTTHGAVVHDNGGYGMLGFGHAPPSVVAALARPYVMANVMTASLAQARFGRRLRSEIGHTRGACPFDRFMCLNSGSEAMTLAMRIADVHTHRQTSPGGAHEGKKIRILSLEGSFHGRTYRPARASHSTDARYRKALASFQSRDDLWTTPINDVDALKAVFERADREGCYIEFMVMEPVQGEGAPGTAVSRAFYDAARALTRQHGTFLIIDSIQAGLRAHGVLSIVDYPGFQDADGPDMETWSKAINAGQFPLSVLGLSLRASTAYTRGVYGNTMTTNPRALDVASAVLDLVTPELRENIEARGAELVDRLTALKNERPDVILDVRGTGLLVAAELDPAKIQVTGRGGAEEWLRVRGIGVIHGGKNALRFTPHFRITSTELDLVVENVRRAIDTLAPARAATAELVGAARA
jgi:acetylornithine/succinyldiaminopimelate/putrescine aminotransferase